MGDSAFMNRYKWLKKHTNKDQKTPVRSSHVEMIVQWKPGVWTVEKLQLQLEKKTLQILFYLQLF